jgi:prepilin-type N-terminal cleavage/methylation domain-containing protein
MPDKGFTLMELIIVVAILAVLAAIGLPRLSRGPRGASTAALEADLEALQKAIDLYATEHGGQLPSLDDIAKQLTQYTDRQGRAQATKDATYIYGPYLRTIPPLPVGRRQGNTRIASEEAEDVGWIYTPASGEIEANAGLTEAEATAIGP